MKQMKTAVIIGAGPAGVSAAYQIAAKGGGIKPVILEQSERPGGISATFEFDGCRIDLGPHRFFSKSDKVMKFWQSMLPGGTEGNFLPVERLTRIFFLRKFFDYPVKLNFNTMRNLGFMRMAKIGIDYIKACVFPIKKEKSLEDFFINRFGRELYLTFFKDYTEKVWGIKCSDISPDWGAQRVKGISIAAVIINAIGAFLEKISFIKRKKIETSLVDSFYYPEYGAGQMYEKIAENAKKAGAEIHFCKKAARIIPDGAKFKVIAEDMKDGSRTEYSADYVISTMPVKELISAMPDVPENVRQAADGLVYRDYLIAAILLKEFLLNEKAKVKDNWIYLQERDMTDGRLMDVNNFSMKMLDDESHFLLGVEYFCTEGDMVWSMDDGEIGKFSVSELAAAGIIRPEDVIKTKIFRQTKAYPAYFGTYSRFGGIRSYLDRFDNLFLAGRNGMHRYNNMDHSVLAGLTAADLIISGSKDKASLWDINTEEEYHEEKKK